MCQHHSAMRSCIASEARYAGRLSRAIGPEQGVSHLKRYRSRMRGRFGVTCKENEAQLNRLVALTWRLGQLGIAAEASVDETA